MSREQPRPEPTPSKDVKEKRGAEFWGTKENFANTHDQCTDFTIDRQYMKDHPEDRVYRNRIATGKTHCFDCLWEADCACVYAECHARSSFFDGYNKCRKCFIDIGKGLRANKWRNCPWCGTKLNYHDFYPLVRKDNTKEDCPHARLFIHFHWMQRMTAESEWQSIFGNTSRRYILRMTKGGEWQDNDIEQDTINVGRIVCLDCMELLYDENCDSWGIVPECVRNIIADACATFTDKGEKDMARNGFNIVYDTKEHIAKWPKVWEADRVK